MPADMETSPRATGVDGPTTSGGGTFTDPPAGAK